MTDDPATHEHRLRPIGERERLLSMDALRGFALLGIFFVNIQLFAMPFFKMVTDPSLLEAPRVDQFAWAFVIIFCSFKFISTFSLLFGAGVMMQLDRATKAGESFVRLHVRRLLMLAIFGLVHGLMFWYGDILLIYAVFGFALLLVRRLQPRTLTKLAVGSIVFSMVLGTGCGAIQMFAKQQRAAQEAREVEESAPADAMVAGDGDAVTDETDEASLADDEPLTGWAAVESAQFNPGEEVWMDAEAIAYAEGPFTDALLFRAWTWFFVVISSVFTYGWHCLGMFLIGAALMKRKFFWPDQRAAQGKMAIIGILIGLPLQFIYAGIFWRAGLEPSMVTMLAGVIWQVGAVALCLGYVGSVCWLASSGIMTPVLKVLGSVGRMALTNYLLETLLATFLMYWWGLGWFGEVGRAQQLLVVVSIYAALIVFSAIWMKLFRIGPMEWLWRSLSYGSIQRLRRRASDV